MKIKKYFFSPEALCSLVLNYLTQKNPALILPKQDFLFLGSWFAIILAVRVDAKVAQYPVLCL